MLGHPSHLPPTLTCWALGADGWRNTGGPQLHSPEESGGLTQLWLVNPKVTGDSVWLAGCSPLAPLSEWLSTVFLDDAC